MEQPVQPLQPAEDHRIGDRAFLLWAAGLAFLGYFAVFLATGGGDALDAAKSSLINLVPLTAVSVAASASISRFLIGRSLAVEAAGHVLFAAAYTLVFYWLLMVMIGVRAGESFTDFVVRAFFPNPAIAWQLLQGLTFYALVAALTYLRARPAVPGFLIPEARVEEERAQTPSRFFIRRGENIHPIDFGEIVSVTGADDYAEVATTTEKHLVRMTLAEFEKNLDERNFIRIHRSRIVNVERIARAEPAGGGRMLLHMDNGEMIQASRAGSKLLKERVI